MPTYSLWLTLRASYSYHRTSKRLYEKTECDACFRLRVDAHVYSRCGCFEALGVVIGKQDAKVGAPNLRRSKRRGHRPIREVRFREGEDPPPLRLPRRRVGRCLLHGPSQRPALV